MNQAFQRLIRLHKTQQALESHQTGLSAWVVLVKDDEYHGLVTKRDFTEKQRKAAAKTGEAMPDGSFPIGNVEDLHNAVALMGHAHDPTAAKEHIERRAAALGAEGELPVSWKKKPVKKGNDNHDDHGRFASGGPGSSKFNVGGTQYAHRSGAWALVNYSKSPKADHQGIHDGLVKGGWAPKGYGHTDE